ncbi:unnamed protein product [Oppiella nova]|uniref:Peptidase C1A papain C-terminal domain-containing protein n=1 Tax=Oppiella nova TaxID=334625 RepID=A0A7R9M1S7_9ACAR|nr:unnamed protein product [Oppiella nova]CAG2168836.1 unnamed protein product [Oppiella nova]
MISAIRSLHTGKPLEPMSAQEVFDCNPEWCICNTTVSAYDAFETINDMNLIIDVERDHPFTGQCTHTCNTSKIFGTGFHMVEAEWMDPNKPIDVEKDLSVSSGPLVVYTKSSSPSFQTYAGGILDSAECNTTGPFDHSLLLVEEGVDNGTEYWLARNSYGESWGEKGYIRLAKGKNMCGIGLGYIAVG